MAARERRCSGKRDIFFIVMILLFVGNIYYIASSRSGSSSTDNEKVDNHKHGDKHKDDTSAEHNTNTKFETPPYVSIIVPLYNQLQYLETTLQSVFSQVFQDYEIIVVNDGSTEWGARSALENLKAAYPDRRITIIHKTRGGLSDARNEGIKIAQAAWILPLDADDILDPNFLQTAVAATQESEVNLVISDLVGFDGDDTSNTVSQWSVPPWDPKELPNKNLLHCCPLYKKELWEATDGYSPVMIFGWEDWEFWLRVNQKIPIKPHTIQDAKFYYRVKPGMHSFCTDYNSLCMSILKTVQPSFYSIEDILHAHQIIANNKEIAFQPIQRQLTEFCDTTPLHLWKGILLEKDGRIQDAILDYEQAKRFAAPNDWQPNLRAAIAKKSESSNRELNALFEQVPGLKEAVVSILGYKSK
eukprot:Phypoly_transcript_09012.p1 GENE.Phypoly_transcript_09012~~Phypoly_transcript_09012.p1  ORF type:complete len:427 (+),score=54.91 Phypoly_transcript_09012:39-1283(+)